MVELGLINNFSWEIKDNTIFVLDNDGENLFSFEVKSNRLEEPIVNLIARMIRDILKADSVFK